MKKAAVIGYGGMGSWHASTCADDFKDTAELIGIYDIKPERRAAAEAEGIHAFSSREELLADERIDLVTVATPNDVHKEIAIAAMAAGKNVISEKPVALSQEELEEMIAASKKYGKLFTVHQNRRWDPDFKCVQKILADNELGKVFRIESRVQGSRGIPGDWRNQKAHGGGMVLDWGIHLLDQALRIGEGRKLISVYAELTNVTNEECDDGFRVTLIFEGDLSMYVEVTTSNFIELPRWYILGENGSAVINDWDLNGDILMWNPVLQCAFEISSMGIRVDEKSLDRQLTLAGCDDRRSLPFHKMLLSGELPLTMGGGIGQSRLCMLMIGACHIGEVQSSIWDKATTDACRDAGILLL